MSFPDLPSAAAAVALVLAALPLARIRRLALAVLSKALAPLLFAAAAGCAVLGVSPGLVPDQINAAIVPFIVDGAPSSVEHAGLVWLIIGGALLLTGLPLLAHLDYAHKVNLIVALFRAIERHAAAASHAAAAPPRSAEASAKRSYPDGDVSAGVAVLRAVLNDANHQPPASARPTLLKDVLSPQSR